MLLGEGKCGLLRTPHLPWALCTLSQELSGQVTTSTSKSSRDCLPHQEPCGRP